MGFKFWGRKKEPSPEALNAKRESEDNLKRARERWEEVRRYSGPRKLPTDEYLSELEEIMRGHR